jgi:hypothetical protein
MEIPHINLGKPNKRVSEGVLWTTASASHLNALKAKLRYYRDHDPCLISPTGGQGIIFYQACFFVEKDKN